MSSAPPLFSFTDPFGTELVIQRSALYVPGIFILVAYVAIPSAFWSILALYAILNVTILLHEWGHALGCRSQGIRVERILVTGMGGLCTFEPVEDERKRAIIIAAGPAANVLLLAHALLLQAIGMPEGMATYIEMTILINVLLLALNLIPVMPRDGGFLFHLWVSRHISEPAAIRASGLAGLLFALIWLPFFVVALGWAGLLILYWVPLRLHWNMARHAEYVVKRPNSKPSVFARLRRKSTAQPASEAVAVTG